MLDDRRVREGRKQKYLLNVYVYNIYMYINMYINIFIMKQGRNIHNNYGFHFCIWSHGHSLYLQLFSFTTRSIFPLPLASVSARHGSLSGG